MRFIAFLLASRASAQCPGGALTKADLTGASFGAPDPVIDSQTQQPIANAFSYPTIMGSASQARLYHCENAVANTVLTVRVDNAASDGVMLWVAKGAVNCDPATNQAALRAGKTTDASASSPDGVGPNDGEFISIAGDPVKYPDNFPVEVFPSSPYLPYKAADPPGTTGAGARFTFSVSNENTAGPFCVWGACLTSTACALTFTFTEAAGNPSATASPSPTQTSTVSGSASASGTGTDTASVTQTGTGSPTSSPTASYSSTATPSETASPTRSESIGATDSITPSSIPSPTPSNSPSLSGTGTPTGTGSATGSRTVSPTGTPTRTRTPPPPPSPSVSASPGSVKQLTAVLWRAAAVEKVRFATGSVTTTVTVSNYSGSALRVVFACGSACEVATTNFYNRSGGALTPNSINLVSGGYAKDVAPTGSNAVIVYSCYAPATVMCVAVQCNSIPVCPFFSYKMQVGFGGAAAPSRWRPTRNQVIGGSLLLLLILLLLLLVFFHRRLRVALGCHKVPPGGSLVKHIPDSGFAPGGASPPQQNPLHVQQAQQAQFVPHGGGGDGYGYGGAAVASFAAPAAVQVAMTQPAPLPPGWVQDTDGTDTWYVNTATNESSWVRPE